MISKTNQTDSSYFTESIDYLEDKANVRTLRYIKITLLVITIIYVLNVLNIFIIHQTLMNYTFLLTIPITAIPVILCHFYGLKRSWIKYMLLMFTILEVGVVGCFLTYHAILISVLPILYSCMYGKKRIIYATFAANVIVTTVAAYLGYFFGLCDGNMLLLTNGPMINYITPDGLPNFTAINNNPWISVGLYYVFPRVLILFIIMLLCIYISKFVLHLSEHSILMRHASETDRMTGLYNCNKYLEVLDSNEYKGETVAVFFFDINSLKYVNDTYGHEYGDILIKKVAESILSVMDTNSKAYRIGGDEMVLFMKQGTSEKIDDLLFQWNSILNLERKVTNLPLSVAIGTAIGNGSDLKSLVSEADKKMYEDKYRQKGEEP